MGDRVSIAFRNDGLGGEPDDGVTLFHHWGGEEFPRLALDYARRLRARVEKRGKNISTPLSRLEPSVIMVDFIRHLWETGQAKGRTFNDEMGYVETGLINDSIYLGKDKDDGDNSDNGHWIVDLRNLILEKEC